MHFVTNGYKRFLKTNSTNPLGLGTILNYKTYFEQIYIKLA